MNNHRLQQIITSSSCQRSPQLPNMADLFTFADWIQDRERYVHLLYSSCVLMYLSCHLQPSPTEVFLNKAYP